MLHDTWSPSLIPCVSFLTLAGFTHVEGLTSSPVCPRLDSEVSGRLRPSNSPRDADVLSPKLCDCLGEEGALCLRLQRAKDGHPEAAAPAKQPALLPTPPLHVLYTST